MRQERKVEMIQANILMNLYADVKMGEIWEKIKLKTKVESNVAVELKCDLPFNVTSSA